MICVRCSICGMFTACDRLYPDWLCFGCAVWALNILMGVA